MDVLEQLIAWLQLPTTWVGPNSLPARVVEHLYFCLIVCVLATVIALPVGYLIGHTKKGVFLAIAAGNATRAVPTLGLLTLAVTFLGVGLPATVIALIAVAIPPILVNSYAGVAGVDAGVRDTANAMGMTRMQIFARVEFPISIPMVMLGLRTATVYVISGATIAAYVGLGGLGRLIFDGLAVRDFGRVTGAAIAVAILAIVVELIFLLISRAVMPAGLKRNLSKI